MVMTNVSFGSLAAGYARRDQKDEKWGDVAAVMTGLPGTPCCVQMSRAFGSAGMRVPDFSWRRPTSTFPGGRKALLAVDEVEDFLLQFHGTCDEVSRGDKGTRDEAAIKAYITGLRGILVFRHAPRRVMPPKDKFEHTELWDGTKTVQRDMDQGLIFSSPRVLFWQTNDPPAWLSGYMGS